MRSCLFLLCGLSVCLAGCQTGRTRDDGGRKPAMSGIARHTSVVEAPAPRAQPSAGPEEKSARLKPGLAVQVDVLVLGKKEIEEKSKRVSDDGAIGLPLIGTVKVAGMTLADVSDELTKRYSVFFVRPQVVVDFVTARGTDAASPWGYVTVLGSVKNPGRVTIPATQDLTVSAAIQQAGGLKPSGKDSAIKVTRRRESGENEVLEINLRAVGTGGVGSKDLTLQTGDVIFVPEMIF